MRETLFTPCQRRSVLNPWSQHSMSFTGDEGVAMRRKRREYSAAERRELWDRWKRGESISDIGRALDRAPGTIHYTIRRTGVSFRASDGGAAWR